MKRSRLLGAAGAGLVMSLVGFTSPAHAELADDLAIMVDNLPAASDAFATSLQEAIDVLVATQSTQLAAGEIGQGLVAAGGQLVAGTEQFGQLGLGFILLNGALQSALAPYLGAIDDPSTASGLVNPDDLATILANLGPAVADAEPHVKSALIEALKGNLNEDLFGGFVPGMGTPAVLGDALQAIAAGAPFVLADSGFVIVLLDDTNYEPVGQVLKVGTLLLAGLGASQIQPVEDSLAPAFEAAAPLTDPLIEILSGL